MKIKKYKKIIMILGVIMIIIALIPLCYKQINNMIINSRPENILAMTYPQVQIGEESTNSQYVKFDSYFFKDLNNDGIADKVRGTCKEIGESDTLYMELEVVENGYLKDGRITVNGTNYGGNFQLTTQLAADTQIKDNYIGSNISNIEFNNLENGTHMLISGIVKSPSTPLNRDKYSKINSITLTGIHVETLPDGTTKETPIQKTVNFQVDWYGTNKIQWDSSDTNQYNYEDDMVNEEENVIEVDFEISIRENIRQLETKDMHIEGTIPKLNGYSALSVTTTDSYSKVTYDSNTGNFVIEKTGGFSDYSYYKYVRLNVTYPMEAYNKVLGEQDVQVPVKVYINSYNNPSGEFQNPYKSNEVQATINLNLFRPRPVPIVRPYLYIDVGYYLSSLYSYDIYSMYYVSKEKPARIYNNLSKNETGDYYPVEWRFDGDGGVYENGVVLKETPNGEKKKSDVIITTDGQQISMENFSKHAAIYIPYNINMLGNDGWINVYNDDTNELLVTFNIQNMNRYSENNPYWYKKPVKHIRVETSKLYNTNSYFYVYNTKELDDTYITNTYSKEVFDTFSYIESYVEAYAGEWHLSTDDTARYIYPISLVGMDIDNNDYYSDETVVSTQKSQDMQIRIGVPKNKFDSYTDIISPWKNGQFLLKFPPDIADVEIKNITTDNPNVKIENYYKYYSEGSVFVKIKTKNDNPQYFLIYLDCTITPNPGSPTQDEELELYTYNEIGVDYEPDIVSDIYDVNENNNIDEKIGTTERTIALIASNSLVTGQRGLNYDDEGSIAVSPRVAEVAKDQRTATVEVNITNNYSGVISEISILGIIPTEGSKYVINGKDIGSDYSTTMTNEGITVPPILRSVAKVYYSEKINATKDLNDSSNGWTMTPRDFSKVKSFLIVLNNYTMSQGETHKFTYNINIPEGLEYDRISYSHHGVYFTLNTTEGKYPTQIEPARLGFMISKKLEPDGGRFIPEEEVDQDKYLYCIANGVHIPAMSNGTQLDATVESGDFKMYVKNPYKGQIIREKYVEDGTNLKNIYTDTKSHSIGKYFETIPPIREGKEGNATDEEAYILSFLDENNSLQSQSQLAMYAIGINEGASAPDNKISIEAKEYAKFRKQIDGQGGYKTSQEKLDTVVGYNVESKKIIIGPYKVDYLRSYTEKGGEKIEFSGIKEIRIYDQDGNIIPSNTWNIEYDENKKLQNRAETYEEYPYPYPNEEFYFVIDDEANENVREISKIEIEHQELNIDAKYSILEGTYNEVEWKAGYRTERCPGGRSCPHGMQDAHIIGHTYYLIADKVTLGRVDSQKLIEVDWVKKEYKKHIQELDIDGKIRLTMNFEGNVWNDQNEMISNGINENNEKKIKGVKVTLYKKDETTPTTKLTSQNPVYTDENGNYRFENIRPGLYEIEYKYDGQTYRTTKFLINGNVTDYKNNPDDEKYINNSKAEETKENRQNLNNRYYEITPNGAIGTDGTTTNLEYRQEGNNSKIVTRNENEVSRQQYEIATNTASSNIYYPLTEKFTINKVEYMMIEDEKNIDLGLSEREKTNENLTLDVYESTFSIKGMTQRFAYNEKNLRNKDQIQDISDYTQYVNRADYEWRWDDSLASVWANANDCELEVYLDYMMIIRNTGENDIAKITELADYYSKNLIYSNDSYRDIEMTSWAVVKSENITESETVQDENKIKVDWSQNSKYGQSNQYSEYNKMYTQSLENLEVGNGKYIELHIIFKINKNNNAVILEGDNANIAEINGYRTFNKDDGSVVGLIDENSRPGNLNPNTDKSTYEDDEDRSPNLRLVMDDDSEENNRYGNTIEGNVWDDLRHGNNTVTLSNNQIVGDGIRQRNEPLVDYVRVELYETFTNPQTGASLTKKVDEARTGRQLSISNNEELNGGYRFSRLSAGNYHVEFIYGEEEQLKHNLKYNGQDYQAVATEDIYKDTDATNNYSDVEIMLGLDISNSMSGEPINQEKRAAIELVRKLNEQLSGVKIGLVAYNSEAAVLGQLGDNQTDLQNTIRGLTSEGETSIQKAINLMSSEYSNNSRKKIIILITDGRPTEETNEDVIKEIEELDDNNIDLITILTKDSEQIFGTESNPRRGKVYRINTENMYNDIVGKIYEQILEECIIKEDRSYGKDNQDERIAQMDKFSTFDLELGLMLDVEGIRNMKEGEQKTEAIRKLAEETKMSAQTKSVNFVPNNVLKDKVEQVNLGLRERPKAELSLEEEVAGIQVKLSDGQIIVDTEKGVNKNVNGLDKEEEKVPISVYMDEEIMHGAEIRVKYLVRIRNTGEIDKMSNYVEGASDETITTQADWVYQYISSNFVYKPEEQKAEENGDIWERIETTQANKVADNVLEAVEEQNLQILQTDGLRVELYPIGSKEAQEGGQTEIVGYIVLSKVISPQDDNATLSFQNCLEIVQRSNEAGRRAYRGIPGNYVPNSDNNEVDNTQARKINITKPLGGEIAKYYVAGALILIIIAGIIVMIKRKSHKKE